jgi:hypothetical protein
MIDTNYCYKKLGVSTHIVPFFELNYKQFEYSDYYGFSVYELPLELILQEYILQDINTKHKIKSGAVIKLHPNRCYKWHQDAIRGVCINMLLQHQESFVLFGNSVSDSEDQFDIARLDYTIGEFYLFNNQVMHTVINFKECRYMFTLEFEEEKNTLIYENFYE